MSAGTTDRTRPLAGASATRAAAVATVAFLIALPSLGVVSDFNLSQVGIRSLWLGIAASSVIFLARDGGMVSLAHTAIYGIAWFTYADLVVKAGMSQWPAVFLGIAAAVAFGLVIGLVASRTTGVYFLMLTLAIGVVVYYFYLQVSQLSGQTGVQTGRAPGLLGGDTIAHPTRLYYAALFVSLAVIALVRVVGRSPFGLALQGIRDDPVRMRALGFRVGLHRALAFALGSLIASFAGIFSVFFNLQISPSSIDINQTIAVLAIAVVGGLSRLEGAWVGALIYSILLEYTQPWAAHLPSALQTNFGPERYPTWLGLVFLVVVVASPDGAIGVLERVARTLSRRSRGAHADV
jgi:branched-chain amino acid transport system permease protein